MTGWVVSTNPSGWKPSERRQVAVLEDPDEGPEAGHDRQRVHDQRLGRQDDRAEQDEQHEVGRHDDEQGRAREVGADPVDDVGDVRRAAPDEDRHPGRRRERPAGRAQGRDQRLALVAVRAVRRVERERGQVARASSPRARSGRSGRAVRSGRRTAACTGPASGAGRRRRGCRRARRADRRRGGASSRTAPRGWPGSSRRPGSGWRGRSARTRPRRTRLEPVERGTRRHLGRQDRGVGCVEPDVQERRAEQQQEGEGRDEDRDRVTHHPARQA